MKQRIKWIDNARGLCIFCVLLAHCNADHTILHQLYTPWFLVLFFFISGFLYKTKTLKEDIVRLVKKLVIPYFLLSIIIFLIGIDNWKAAINHDYFYLFDKIQTILIGRHLWFIPCIIMVQLYFILLSHTVMKTRLSKFVFMILTLCSVYLIKNETGYVAPYSYDIALFALSFFIMGSIYKSVSEDLSNRCSAVFSYLSKPHVSVCIFILYLAISYLLQNTLDMEFHFADNFYKRPLLFITLAITGIVTVSMVANSFSAKYLQFLGENSLTAFAFNGKAYAASFIFMKYLVGINSTLYAIILCFMEGVLLLLLAKLINKYCPFIVGK